MSVLGVTFNHRCPYCTEGQLFAGWFSLRETCEVCGARYERHEGAWIGPTTIGYGIGAVVGVGGGAILLTQDLYFKGAEVLLGLFACAVVLLCYRWVKAYWIGLMHSWGHVYPDPPATSATDEVA